MKMVAAVAFSKTTKAPGRRSSTAAAASWKTTIRTTTTTAFLLMLLLLSATNPVLVLAGLNIIPEHETEYSEEFFRAHREHQEAYDVLVQAMGNIVEKHLGKQQSTFKTLDVGCGHGLLVEAWRTAGIRDSYCIEGSASAAPMWPPQHREEYYQVLDLADTPTIEKAEIPETDVVTTFEVAEHLPASSAEGFVQLLVRHNPAFVFFGAATVHQDLGQNPSHVNERPFRYWIWHFRNLGYVPDVVATVDARETLLNHPSPALLKAWWYPKNLLVFVPASRQNDLDRNLAAVRANLLDEAWLGLMGPGLMGQMWRRDWTEFGTIFHRNQQMARQRLAEAANRGESGAGPWGEL